MTTYQERPLLSPLTGLFSGSDTRSLMGYGSETQNSKRDQNSVTYRYHTDIPLCNVQKSPIIDMISGAPIGTDSPCHRDVSTLIERSTSDQYVVTQRFHFDNQIIFSRLYGTHSPLADGGARPPAHGDSAPKLTAFLEDDNLGSVRIRNHCDNPSGDTEMTGYREPPPHYLWGGDAEARFGLLPRFYRQQNSDKHIVLRCYSPYTAIVAKSAVDIRQILTKRGTYGPA